MQAKSHIEIFRKHDWWKASLRFYAFSWHGFRIIRHDGAAEISDGQKKLTLIF